MSRRTHHVESPVLRERHWRLVDTGFASGPRNMAIDEAILLAHSRGEVPPTLRFYGWEPPAVSIGYFQRMAGEVDLEACRRLGYGWVRRPTGGRAIFHHRELTYSVVIREELLPGGVIETYRFLAAGLLAGLRRLGAPAEMAGGEKDPRALGGEASPACFDTPSAYELVVGGRKIVGSAQTRRAGTILQHGSILLDLDVDLTFTLLKVPPERREAAKAHLRSRATSLREALGREVSWAEARDAFIAGFAEALGITLTPGELTPAEVAEAERLEAEKYGHDRWNLRR
ncbi:MAG: lipoate--protein ligase family protein [Firmicutes bacterium]|nr:lipoate--protein ligase family protein [Bacillota bacterium]